MDLYLKKKKEENNFVYNPLENDVFGTKNGQFKKEKNYIYYLKNAECYVRERKKDFSYVGGGGKKGLGLDSNSLPLSFRDSDI